MSTYLGRPAETGLGALPTARTPPQPEKASSVADQFSPIRGHRLPLSWNRTLSQSLPTVVQTWQLITPYSALPGPLTCFFPAFDLPKIKVEEHEGEKDLWALSVPDVGGLTGRLEYDRNSIQREEIRKPGPKPEGDHRLKTSLKVPRSKAVGSTVERSVPGSN